MKELPANFLPLLSRKITAHELLAQEREQLRTAEANTAKLEQGLDFKLRVQAERRTEDKEIQSSNQQREGPDVAKAKQGLEIVRASGTRSDFDRYQLITKNQRNHDVVKAQVAFERSKKLARELGILPPHLQTSEFGDERSHDYAESVLAKMVQAVDRDGIEEWRRSSGMRQVISPDHERSPDGVVGLGLEGARVGIEDSRSLAAQGNMRKRIDEWARPQ